MKTEITFIIGVLAGTCTTIAFLPQTLKSLREKSTKDISLSMFVIYSIGVILWLTYGLIRHDLPVIIANVVTLGFALAMLGLKLKHGD